MTRRYLIKAVRLASRTRSVRRTGGFVQVAFLDAIMKPEFHRTYPVHDLVATDKSLLDSLIAGAKGGTRTSNDS